MQRLKVGIVGCGVISDVYIKSIREKFSVIELYACSDLDEQRMNDTAHTYQLKAMTYQQMLEDPDVDVVLNLTSPGAHYALTKQALEHGKHVFSEKMLAVEFEQGKELCEIAARKHLRLGCAPDTFLGGGIQTARYIIDHGMAGTIYSGTVSLTRNYRVFGENLPHLFKKGGSILYDMGCYYLTALCSILGPVRKVIGLGKKTEERHLVTRTDSKFYGQEFPLDDENVIGAVLEFQNGCLVTVHFNSGSILNETFHFDLYGSDGIVRIGDPNTFGGMVSLEKPKNLPVTMPFTHGYLEESRGIGVAEMAWSILSGRPHRAGMEMACHVLEIVHGIQQSIRNGTAYCLTTDFEQSAPLPEGYIGKGFWEPTEETALI